MILSTIVRAMAGVLAADGVAPDGARLARALRAGATAAYEAVEVPAEGTILTVIREMAEEAEPRPEPQVEGYLQ